MAVTNLLIILNLGCEMLYVIDQRLKAQAIPLDKSAQVLREITEVLLDPKFLHYISTAYQQSLLTVQQTRILLTDIACCSLMRLDVSSMDKLWDLMVMIFKWQLFLTNKNAQLLMDLTFRHLDGIGRLIPEMRKQILIDNVKKSLIDLWEPLCEDEQTIVHRKVYKWLKPYNTKISILIRMRLQRANGEFETEPKNNIFYNYYVNNIGENIYSKTANLAQLKATAGDGSALGESDDGIATNSHELDTLVQQLNIQHLMENTGVVDAQEQGNSEGIHRGLSEIVIDHSTQRTQQNLQSQSTTVDPNDTTTVPPESNLVKFMKKIHMNKDEFGGADGCGTIDANEELLKMFDQSLELN